MRISLVTDRGPTHIDRAFVWTAIRILVVLVVFAVSQATMADRTAPATASSAPPYMRHHPGPAYGNRPYGPPSGGRYRRTPWLGYGSRGYAPWFSGGFYSPPIYGSWYQRPYPYHFDFYRGRFRGRADTRPDLSGQSEQPQPNASSFEP